MNKNIMITGGYGFIASNFVNEFRHIYKKYIIVDKMTYASNKENVVDKNGDLVIITDINNIPIVGMRSMMDSSGFPYEYPLTIVNFAAESHVDNSIGVSNVFVKSNINGTHKLLDWMKNRNIESDKFIQISTDEVYGSISNR